MNLLSFYIYVFIFLKLLHLTFHKYFLNILISFSHKIHIFFTINRISKNINFIQKYLEE